MVNERYKALSDASIVKKVLEGNEDSILYFFYERFAPTFQYHIYNIFQKRENIQELIDEFFLYLYEGNWKRLRSYDSSKASLNTWISTVSFRFFIKYKHNTIDSRDVVTIKDDWETSTATWAEEHNTEILNDIRKAINEIENERDRMIATRFFIEDADPERVALEYRLDINYVYTVKQRIRSKLQKKLKNYAL